MGNGKKPSTRTKSGAAAIIAPTKTLDETDSAVLVGSLVWGKFDGYPWWPGLVVTTADVRWPISMNDEDSHCILWLGPNKTASQMPAQKLSNFLDSNLNELMNQQNGDDFEEATCEALRGVLSQQTLEESELDNIPAKDLKSMVVLIQTQREGKDGRNQVVLEQESIWYKRTLESLRYSNKSLTIVLNEKKESPRLSSASKSQKRESVVSPVPSSSNKEEESSSSSTSEIDPNNCVISIREEEQSPPTKKRALSVPLPQDKQLANGNIRFAELREEASVSPPSRNVARKHTNPIMRTAHLKGLVSPPSSVPSNTSSATAAKPSSRQVDFIKLEFDGALKMQMFLQDERFRSLELPKLIEEEKLKHVIDLNIRTSGHEKVQLVSWSRFRSLYRSGKIQIFCSRTRFVTLVIREPTAIVVNDGDSFDIRSMENEAVLPDAVEKLLALLGDASDQTGHYAFLLYDGLNWKLIGCFNAGVYAPPPSKPAEEATKSALLVPNSSGVKNKEPRNTEEQKTFANLIHVERQLPSPAMPIPDAAIGDNPSKEAIIKATKLLQNQLGERIKKLNLKLLNIV